MLLTSYFHTKGWVSYRYDMIHVFLFATMLYGICHVFSCTFILDAVFLTLSCAFHLASQDPLRALCASLSCDCPLCSRGRAGVTAWWTCFVQWMVLPDRQKEVPEVLSQGQRSQRWFLVFLASSLVNAGIFVWIAHMNANSKACSIDRHTCWLLRHYLPVPQKKSLIMYMDRIWWHDGIRIVPECIQVSLRFLFASSYQSNFEDILDLGCSNGLPPCISMPYQLTPPNHKDPRLQRLQSQSAKRWRSRCEVAGWVDELCEHWEIFKKAMPIRLPRDWFKDRSQL